MTGSKILVIINDSWGEVDWILPVLTHLKEKWTARISVFFNDDAIYNEKSEYQDLHERLEVISKEIITPSKLKETVKWRYRIFEILKLASKKLIKVYLLPRYVKGLVSGDLRFVFTTHDLLKYKCGKNVDFIFHDFSGIDFTQYYRDFPQSKVVVFPHGTFIHGWIDNKLKEEFSRFMYFQTIDRDALLLLGSHKDLAFFKTLTSLENIVITGHPKLEKIWVDSFAVRRIEGRFDNETRRFRILFIQYPKRRMIKKDVFESFVSTVLDIAESNNIEIIMKRHPRQDENELKSILERYRNLTMDFATESVLSAATRSDLAISFPSSACMDAIAAGIPVIEYFDYSSQKWTTFVKTDGGRTSIYRKLGLVVPANNGSELEQEIRRLTNDREYSDRIKTAQKKALEKLQVNRGHVLEVIESLLKSM